MKKTKFLIGSRGSKLALLQTEKVCEKLRTSFPACAFEIEVIRTLGDHSGPWAQPEAGSAEQGIFTKEIDEALRSGRVDLAVHSAKDLPTRLAPSLTIGAVLERDEARDAWVSRTGVPLAKLPRGATVATSSPRRKAQLLRFRPDLKMVALRGNVPTRLGKVGEGLADGLVLAACGLARLGMEKEITELLETEIMLPAVGQGAIVVQIRQDDEEVLPMMRVLDHEESVLRLEAERRLLAHLRGGCQVPVGVESFITDGHLSLEAGLFSPDGARMIRRKIAGEARRASELGEELAARLANEGGAEILEAIRKERPVEIPSP